MYTAEETLNAIKASENWETNGPDTKKRRSVGDIPHNSSQSTPSQTVSSHSQSNAPSAGFSTSANGNPTSFFPSKAYPTSNGTVSPIATNEDDMNVDLTPEDEYTPSVSHCATAVGRTPSPMTISLDGLSSNLDPAKMFAWTHNNGTSTSAPQTSHADHVMCPTCGKAITDSITMSKLSSTFTGSPSGSPLVVPPGPLAAAAFESGMSGFDEECQCAYHTFMRYVAKTLNNYSQKIANNLTDQVRSISEVTKAVALGDLGKTVEVDVQGEMLDLKMTVNSMVAQLSTLADEVTRVSLEVGTEGLLGGQAFVPDVEGMWKVSFPVCMRLKSDYFLTGFFLGSH